MSAAALIHQDATVASLHHEGMLVRPIGYTKGVLQNMAACQQQTGALEIDVRIGVHGDGRVPNYRVEYATDDDAAPRVHHVYSGDGHAVLTDERAMAEKEWSAASMTVEDVEGLLRRLYGIRG